MSDNGPQYVSQEFGNFAKEYNFQHTTSSPHFPQSNGDAERAVQTAKRLLKNSKDPHMALLSYRATPLPWCGLSPAQLRMGRQIQSNIPQITKTLIPQWPYLGDFWRNNEKEKQKQKSDFNTRHGTRALPEIPDNTAVWITSDSNCCSPGHVTTPTETSRSYL